MIICAVSQVGCHMTISVEYEKGERPAKVCDYLEENMKAIVTRYHNMYRLNTATISFSFVTPQSFEEILSELKKIF